jgi:hypothetical protein
VVVEAGTASQPRRRYPLISHNHRPKKKKKLGKLTVSVSCRMVGIGTATPAIAWNMNSRTSS